MRKASFFPPELKGFIAGVSFWRKPITNVPQRPECPGVQGAALYTAQRGAPSASQRSPNRGRTEVGRGLSSRKLRDFGVVRGTSAEPRTEPPASGIAACLQTPLFVF